MSDRATGADRDRSARVVVAAVLVAAAVTVLELPGLDAQTSSNYDVLDLRAGHDVPALVSDAAPTVQARFGIYVALRELAPGAALVQPRSARQVTPELIGLGTLDAVLRTDYDPLLPAEVAEALLVTAQATGEARDLGAQYAVAVAGGEPTVLVHVEGADHVLLVDLRLLEEFGVTPADLGIEGAVRDAAAAAGDRSDR